MVSPLWTKVSQVLIKLTTYLSYDPAIPLLGIYPGEMRNYVCTWMFTETAFIITKRLETTQMSISGWITKHNVVHLYSGILLSHKKADLWHQRKEWFIDTSYNMDESQKYYVLPCDNLNYVW